MAIGFVALLGARFFSIHRQRIFARWPAFAFAAAALVLLWRGGIEPALACAALAVAAWFVSPTLLAPKPIPATPNPADMQARSVLGVGPTANANDIRAAYRRKMADAHPDRGGSHDAAARLTAARDALLKRKL